MSSEQFDRNRLDRDHKPAQNESPEAASVVQTVERPFAEFGRSIDAQLLELEVCHVLAGAAPRRNLDAATRRRMFR